MSSKSFKDFLQSALYSRSRLQMHQRMEILTASIRSETHLKACLSILIEICCHYKNVHYEDNIKSMAEHSIRPGHSFSPQRKLLSTNTLAGSASCRVILASGQSQTVCSMPLILKESIKIVVVRPIGVGISTSPVDPTGILFPPSSTFLQSE